MAVEKVSEVYKCGVCGNIVEVVNVGGGELVCCGQPMDLMKEKTADSSTEKHVPVIEKTGSGYKVTVGSTLHPMTDEHWIQWIELIADGKAYRQFLNPGDQPVAEFCVDAKEVTAREYCNLHGLWKS
jgi:superoxide reductase